MPSQHHGPLLPTTSPPPHSQLSRTCSRSISMPHRGISIQEDAAPIPRQIVLDLTPTKKTHPLPLSCPVLVPGMKGISKSCCGQEKSQDNPKTGGTSRYQQLLDSIRITDLHLHPPAKAHLHLQPQSCLRAVALAGCPVLPESFLGAAGPQLPSIPNVWMLLFPHCPKASVAQAHAPLAATKSFCLLVKAWE